MSEKTVHIIFEILNYLFSDQSAQIKISDDEKLMLILLARHKGEKGIYPAFHTLAKELKKSRRVVIRTIQRLEEKNLIQTEKRKGRSNYYYIKICSNISVVDFKKLSTTSVAHDTSVLDDTRVAHVTGGVSSTSLVECRPRHPININNNLKEVIQRDGAKSAPNSPSFSDQDLKKKKQKPFVPDDSSLKLVADLSLNLSEEIESFENRHNGKKSQYEFKRWVLRSSEYRKQKGNAVVEPVRPRGIDFTALREEREDRERLERERKH